MHSACYLSEPCTILYRVDKPSDQTVIISTAINDVQPCVVSAVRFSSQEAEVELTHIFFIILLCSWTVEEDGMALFEFHRLNKAPNCRDTTAVDALCVTTALVNETDPCLPCAIRHAPKNVQILLMHEERHVINRTHQITGGRVKHPVTPTAIVLVRSRIPVYLTLAGRIEVAQRVP